MKGLEQTKYFEVYVDDFKVVPKTDNIQSLENYEQYTDEDTETLKVFIYNTPDSNRYTQRIFRLKEKPQIVQQAQQLSGVEMESKIKDGINEGLKGLEEKLACEQVKKELADTQKKLSDSEDFVEKLKSRIEILKEKLENAKTAKEIINAVTEFGPFLLGAKTKPDPSLSGAQTEKKPEEQASFKMKTEGESSVSEDDKHFIKIGKMVEGSFSEEELLKVYDIIDAFASDKANINSVESFLNLNTNQQKTKTENGKV